MRKVVFLDIDGVLNSNVWNECHQQEISEGILIDEEKIKLLASLVKSTNSKLVLHSGWRIWFDSEIKPLCKEAQKLVELLAKAGLILDDLTPDLTTKEIRENKMFSLVKADEILLWLEINNDVCGWVVLEDLDLHNAKIALHQVKTDQTIGLSLENIEEAKKIQDDWGKYEIL